MKPGEVLDVAMQMARGLAEAHSHNIIHRDVKPSNVMFASGGLVKIVDCGPRGIDGPIQVASASLHADVGLVDPPRLVGRLEMRS